MKKNWAVYLAVSTLLFLGVSCMSSDDGSDVVLSPFALVKSFSIGNIKSTYPAFTSTGEDTVVVKTIATTAYPFTIDQAAGLIYNIDSLPYCTNTSKLVISASVTGYLSMYVDSTDSYEYFSSTDSLDFSYPRRIRVLAADTEYHKDYTVSVNVHQVEPELMQWSEYQAPQGLVPQRAVELDGKMYLFGAAGDGSQVVTSAELAGEPVWSSFKAVSGFQSAADLATINKFGDALYAIAGGNLYKSVDAVEWSVVLQGEELVAIVGVSEQAGEMWLASADRLLCGNGAEFKAECRLPSGFPLYGLSIASYPLAHNRNIIRYMAIGYTAADKNSAPVVWSRISNEDAWVKYDNGNQYPCPQLNGLAVFRYDNDLYAFGGAGKAGDTDVEAFDSLYVSKDNGIVWKTPKTFYHRMPRGLSGCDAPFAATADSHNFIWIVTGGENAMVWKGIINRLGFKNR